MHRSRAVNVSFIFHLYRFLHCSNKNDPQGLSWCPVVSPAWTLAPDHCMRIISVTIFHVSWVAIMYSLSGVHSRIRDTLVCCVDSPAETSDFCRPELWRVRRSQLLLICSLSFCGSGLSWTESSNPSGFHVLNWKRMEKPPAPGDADGSDRKLLLELTKVQATSWGCEHEKVTLP